MFWVQTVPIPPIHILPKNHKPKNANTHKDFFLNQFPMNNCLCQTVTKSSFYIPTKLPTTWLTQFCVITHQLNYFWLCLYYLHKLNFMLEFRLLTAAELCQCYQLYMHKFGLQKSWHCPDTPTIFISDLN